MCQFNLVFVRNSKNKKILKSNEYVPFENDFNDFSSFVKGHCNCGSFVGSMCEYSGNSYLEMVESLNKTQLKKLNQIKAFMNTPDYMDLRKTYIETRDSFSNAIEKLYEPLSTYEINQINILEKKYKGKELQKHIELLYKKLDNKVKKLENSSEFKSAEAKLNSFISENELMEESTIYFLTKEDENKEFENGLDNDSLDAFEYSVDCITIPEDDSLVIDNVIQKTENTYKNNYNIFLEYKYLFEKLLENEDYILFSCIWDEPRELFVDKAVNINDLKIEDLASIEFDKILKIYK